MTKKQVINWIGKKNWKFFIEFYGINFKEYYNIDKVLEFIWGNK